MVCCWVMVSLRVMLVSSACCQSTKQKPLYSTTSSSLSRSLGPCSVCALCTTCLPSVHSLFNLCLQPVYPLSNLSVTSVYHLSTLCPPCVYLQGKAYDGKTDVWAIGCVLYEMCALKKAFDASNLGAITVKVMRYPPLLHPCCTLAHHYCHLGEHQCTCCLHITSAYQVYKHIIQLCG